MGLGGCRHQQHLHHLLMLLLEIEVRHDCAIYAVLLGCKLLL